MSATIVLQWCELCRELVEEVDPCCFRGGEIINVCHSCQKFFPVKLQTQWGRYEFQCYWDLGPLPLPPPMTTGKKRIFHAFLTKRQVAQLRASGYEVLKEIEGNDDTDSAVEIQEDDSGDSCIS